MTHSIRRRRPWPPCSATRNSGKLPSLGVTITWDAREMLLTLNKPGYSLSMITDQWKVVSDGKETALTPENTALGVWVGNRRLILISRLGLPEREGRHDADCEQ